MKSSIRIVTLLILAGAFVSGCKYTHSPGSSTGTLSACVAQFAPATASITPLGINEVTQSTGDVAQSIQVSQSISVSVVSLQLKAVVPTTPSGQSVSGQLTLSLESNNGTGVGSNAPSGVALASAQVAANTVGSSAYQSYDFRFASPVGLVQNETYWLVLSASYGASYGQTNYIEWAGSSSNQISGNFEVLVTSLATGNSPTWMVPPVTSPSSFEMAFGVGCP